MNNEQFQILLRFFKALADESRLKILAILANQECSVEELATLLQLKEPTVSHHLARLKELNLVIMRPEGNAHFYQLDSQALQNISKQFFTPQTIASLVEDVDIDAWESKVLKTYLEGDIDSNGSVLRLREIPASRKKRLVIIKWLASKFEVGIRYEESSVNAILKLYYSDVDTLRRELVNYQMMQSKNGFYWRLVED